MRFEPGERRAGEARAAAERALAQVEERKRDRPCPLPSLSAGLTSRGGPFVDEGLGGHQESRCQPVVILALLGGIARGVEKLEHDGEGRRDGRRVLKAGTRACRR